MGDPLRGSTAGLCERLHGSEERSEEQRPRHQCARTAGKGQRGGRRSNVLQKRGVGWSATESFGVSCGKFLMLVCSVTMDES